MTHEEMWAAGALTVDEASAFAGLSRATLYRLVRAGRLVSHVTGGRRLFARASLVELLSDGDQRPRDLEVHVSKRQTQASDKIEQIAATLVRCLEAIGEPTPGNRLFEERVATDAAETLGCVCCILDEAKALNNPAAREVLDAVGLVIHAHLLTLDPTAKVGNMQRVLDDLTLRVVELVDVRDNDDDGHEYETTGWEP